MSFEYQKYTTLYTVTLRDILDGWGTLVHEGGTSSSKTFSILQALFVLALHDPGCVITVVGQDIPNLKKGAMRDAKQILADEPTLKAAFYPFNKTDRIYESIHGGSLIEFNSYDDEQDAKSGKRDYAFFNEANGIPYPVFDAVNVRTNTASIIDFNPTAEFWAHEKLLPDTENRKWYVSNFLHNPFIDPYVKAKILSYEPTEDNIKRGTADPYRWDVYGLGKVGRLEGAVFEHWDIVDDFPTPQECKWVVYGLDFGFTNDPSAFIKVALAHGELYFHELFYRTGLTNQDIVTLFEQYNIPKKNQAGPSLIIADSAEPKSIEEIARHGYHIKGAEKGKDSVNFGIDLMKQYKMNVTAASENIIKELRNYRWETDKDGNPLNKPIDQFNHCIDGIRYPVTYQCRPQKKIYSPPLPGRIGA